MIWIDQSIAPTLALARAKVALLQLEGELIRPSDRTNVLLNATAGDTVYCGPLELPFWRKLGPRVRLVSVDHLEDQDPVSSRIESWLEWALCQQGLTQTEARRLIASPPKTEKHGQWLAYQTAEQVAQVMAKASEQLGDLPQSDDGASQKKALPYNWMLVDSNLEVLAAEYNLEEAVNHGIPIGVDVETDVAGERPNEMRDKLVGVGISVGKECYYGSIEYEPWADLLRTWLPQCSYVAHNSKYDYCVLRQYGITPGRLAGDGRLAAYLLGEPEAALKGLVQRKLDFQMITYDEVVGVGASRVNISEVDKELVAEYCCADAYFGVEIEKHLKKGLSEKALKLYEEVELPLVDILADMQFEGMPVDRDAIEDALGDTEQRMDRLAEVIDALACNSGYVRPYDVRVCKECHNGKNKKLTCNACSGAGAFYRPAPLNPASSPQLIEWLHDHLGLPVQALTKETQKPSVSGLALLRMRELNPAIPIILQWKSLQKYKGFLVSWFESSKDDDRLHPVYNNARTRSGRLSAQEPNVQQIKLEWRKFFIAEENHVFVCADYGQIEVRVAAYASHDPKLLTIMQADPETFEGDVHSQNVTKLFGIPFEDQEGYKHLRTRAKNYFFGALYGSGGWEIQEVIEKQFLQDPELLAHGVPTLREIQAGIRDLRDEYAHYFSEWVPYEVWNAREHGNTVYTLFGRPRILSDLTSQDKREREAAEREAISHIVQGSSADVLRMATIKVAAIPNGRLVLTVHDELGSMVEEGQAVEYKEAMVNTMLLGQPFEDVPLVVDAAIGRTWYDCHK